jgi:hypothetical protein
MLLDGVVAMIRQQVMADMADRAHSTRCLGEEQLTIALYNVQELPKGLSMTNEIMQRRALKAA